MEALIKHKALLEHMALVNTPGYTFDKIYEELFEFGEALVKQRTKSPSNPLKPNVREVIKEYGDVIYRGIVALLHTFPQMRLEQLLELVNEHIEYKLEAVEHRKETQPEHKDRL